MEFLPRNKKLRPNATKLRKNMTPQERHLWYDFLRHSPVQWSRQRIIGDFVVDFFCLKAKLVLEVDGGQHYGVDGLCQSDRARTSYLENLGLKVLRFTNREVEENFSGVCEQIHAEVERRAAIPTALRAEPLSKGAAIPTALWAEPLSKGAAIPTALRAEPLSKGANRKR